MARPLGQLERLGAHVAFALDEDTTRRVQALETARRGFLEHELSVRSPRAWFSAPRWGWAMGVAGALAVVTVLVLTHHRAAIGFQVDGAPGVARTWLAAPEGSALDLAFSEGTRVQLEAAARGRVTDIDEHGASLTLESGRLHAEVVHQSDSAWKVVAGPFTIRVTGTVFDVSWDATSQQLAVTVDRGSVSVRDASTGLEQAVRASETLHASAYEHEHRLTVAPSAASSSAQAEPTSSGDHPASPDAPDGSLTDAGPAETRDPTIAPPAKNAEIFPGRAPAAGDEWRAFAKRGALREAFASADAAGFTQTCAGASPSELLILGDGARLSGSSARAEEALLTLRRRYPTDPRRAAAAFSLGKVAFDQRGAYEQAAAWFSTSLREQPGGPLAREAAGRLIEALRRADDSAGARRAARDYLDKYPEGPHADLARSVLR
jgi:transmembrane sensor